MRTSRRVLYALLLAAAGSFVACERTEDVGGLTGITPQFSKTSNARVTRLLNRSGTFNTNEVCTNGFINKSGGTLNFDGGSIEVSKNAVQTPTVFCARNMASGEYKVALRAFEWGNGRPVTQFRTVVKLTLDLSASDIGDWSTEGGAIKVYYLNPNGTLEAQPTSQSRTSKAVTANLTHFSDYAPGKDWSPAD